MFGDLLGLKDEPIHIIRWTGLMGMGRSVSTGGSTNGMSFLRFWWRQICRALEC